MTVTLGKTIASLRVQRMLHKAAEGMGQAAERLSSGQRINRASDDAAGLAVGMALQSSSRVYSQAIRNIGDGLSFLTIADGALAELSTLVERQKELAEQAANGVYSKVQRTALHKEANALVDEWNRIVSSTRFNGINPFDAAQQNVQIQAGIGEASVIEASLGGSFLRTVGAGTFQAGVTIDVTGSPAAAFGGDFNNDGKQDIVVAAISGGSLLLGNGDGTFQAPVVFTAVAALDLGVADLNNDGNLDVVYDGWGSSYVSVLFGNGNGTFRVAGSFATTGQGNGVTFADFNLDNQLDFANVNRNSGEVHIFLNQGNGTFTNARSFTTAVGSPYRISTGDYNNDGIPDLVSRGLYYGVGDGSFRLAYTAPFNGAISVAFADFNLDGLDDFALKSGSSIGVTLNRGDGTLPPEQLYSASIGAGYSFAGIDLNGDGYADILGGGYNTNSVVNVLINKGNGTFNTAVTYVTGGGSHVFDAQDFNGDGAPDIVSANYNTGDISVLLQNTTRTASMAHYSLYSAADARSALSLLEETQARVTAGRSAIGAAQSRLLVAQSNLYSTRENYIQAASRILDADVAEESAQFVRSRILQQAASAVLMQANIQPEIALRLLGR